MDAQLDDISLLNQKGDLLALVVIDWINSNTVQHKSHKTGSNGKFAETSGELLGTLSGVNKS